jgi:hypothetical protein
MSDYLSEVIKNKPAADADGYVLVPEEQALADALLDITDEYGKFNADNTGVWAGYSSAADNVENAEIGVKCGNCVFFNAPNGCSIITAEVEEGGLCRFAVLPDGAVTASADPCWKNYKQLGMKKKNGKMVPNCVPDTASITADADYGDACPPATQDIVINLENRQNAIDKVGYGPLNPDEANTEFWQDKADRWKTTPVEASKSICGNCVFFDRRPKTLDCIETGIASGGSGDESAWDAIDQAELGYCTALDFKCAASRTCNAWAAGGPIVEDKQAEVASGGPGVSAPVLKEGDIKAPVNGKKLRLPMRNEIALRKKVLDYNTKNPQTPFTASVDMLKAVYRRGAGTYNGGEFSSQTRDDWSLNRVDAFLSLLANGKPANAAYTQDFDLLPLEHTKSTRGTASLTASAASDYSYELAVELMNEDDYESQEHAIHVLAEFSGLGYDVIPAIRAAWLRGLKNEENPYERAAILATALYSSPDADLLPKKGTL